jgi:hypothetical protein
MKMADILRNIADLLDQPQDGNDGVDLSNNRTQNRLDAVQVNEPELDDNPVMVPPLQAKLEILKKSEGLPNAYDGEGEGDDELVAIKKNAGLTAAQHEASEDNDITG